MENGVGEDVDTLDLPPQPVTAANEGLQGFPTKNKILVVTAAG